MHPIDLTSEPATPPSLTERAAPRHAPTVRSAPETDGERALTPEAVLERYQRTRRRVNVLRATVADFRQRLRDLSADATSSRGSA